MICSWFGCNGDAAELIEVDEAGMYITPNGLPLCKIHIEVVMNGMYLIVPADRRNMFL